MKNIVEDKLKSVTYSDKWKNGNYEYRKQLQKFFDIVDNVKNEELRMDILYQMLKCDEILLHELESKYKK